MSYDPAAVAAQIAGLSVSGVSIRTLSTMPPAIQQRDCPILYPAFDFVAGASGQPRGLGLGGAALTEYRYTLNYLYAHAPIGAGRYPTEYHAAIAANMKAIIDAARALDTQSGALYLTLANAAYSAVVADPSENQLWGGTISFSVWEKT